MNILNVEHLARTFGEHTVLEDVSFRVPEHRVFGFLGQNGAGKTTTMKIVLGLMKATAGKVTIMDEPVTYGQTKTNRFVGYLPDVPEFYGFMKPKEYLKLCGEITNMPDVVLKKRTDELLELVGLKEVNKKIGGFSRGMKQRLGIAQALLNEPKLLICDEPTSALDPVGRKEILDILSQVKGKTTVVFSTHILSDVERICDDIAILHQGKISVSGSITERKEKNRSKKIVIQFRSEMDKQQFLSIPEYRQFMNHTQVQGSGIQVKAEDTDSAFAFILNLLTHHHIIPSKIEVLEPSLEDIFMEVIG